MESVLQIKVYAGQVHRQGLHVPSNEDEEEERGWGRMFISRTFKFFFASYKNVKKKPSIKGEISHFRKKKCQRALLILTLQREFQN